MRSIAAPVFLRVGPRSHDPVIVYASPAMRDVCATAERVAGGDGKILITGESGVGKDLIAQYIHARSPRAKGRFVAVNCAAFPETLLETELFGHAKGSFTGAYRDKPGRLRLAHQGTIFLDEVGEMSLRMQAQLLRFLESGEIQTVGREGEPTRVDVRILTATNRDLSERVASGHFREDLLYRIKVIHLHVPPLRDRREDVRPLVLRAVARGGRPVRLTEEALEALERYRWPGNVRELQNVVEQVTWMSKGEEVALADLPEEIRLAPNGLLPKRERRRQLANELYDALVGGHYGFWDHIRALFLSRDMTRHDLRQLLRRGLTTTRGNYRALLPLFGVPESDYKRFMNFLAAHDCVVDFREFRNAPSEADAMLSTIAPAPRPVRARSRSAEPAA
jgi:transcriptional regulator with PAS, ATPase and Fis domain